MKPLGADLLISDFSILAAAYNCSHARQESVEELGDAFAGSTSRLRSSASQPLQIFHNKSDGKMFDDVAFPGFDIAPERFGECGNHIS